MEKLVVVVLQARITRPITALAATGAMLYDVIGFLEHLFNHAVFIGYLKTLLFYLFLW